MISIAGPLIGDEEIKAVNDVLASGNLSAGAKTAELEKDFAKYCGTKHALALNSGTAAIHAALHAAGIGEGDEVITVPFSFIATVNPILMLGARPVFVDVTPDTFCLDVTKLERAITPKTKAIIPVHLFGQPADMDEINNIAKKRGLAVIEDSCQAVSAEYKGEKTGSLGDIGCFSLYATKNITSGEGGLITTNSDEYAELIRRFRQHGMSAPYQYEELGYNYRITDLQSAIAVEQLKKADRFTETRQRNAEALTRGLGGVKGLILPTVSEGRTHVFHQYTVRITDEFPVSRDELVAKLKEKEIGTGVYYPRGLHTYPHIAKYGYNEGDFPIAEKMAGEVVSLPVNPAVTADDIKTIVGAIKEIANG